MEVVFILIYSIVIALSIGCAYFYWPRQLKISSPEANFQGGCSIIICAKNEELNLQKLLPALLHQDFPHEKLEVIIVDDGSTDSSPKLLQEYAAAWSELIKIITLDPNSSRDFPGKKWALLQGIQAAKYDRLLLTDADCLPASKDWIQSMLAYVGDENTVVLGYGGYRQQDGFLNKFIQFETLHTFMQYAQWAVHGRAYMGVGRNLSYSKSAVLPLWKDEQLTHILKQCPSGDDDLVIQALHQQHVIFSVAGNSNSFTLSHAPASWKEWWKQKTRHVSAGKYYPTDVKIRLGVYAMAQMLFWVLSIGALCMEWSIFCVGILLLFIIRNSIYGALYYRWSKIVQLNYAPLILLFLDFCWSVYNIALSPFVFFKNQLRWK